MNSLLEMQAKDIHLLQGLADDVSTLVNTPLVKQENVFYFQLGKKTFMVMEKNSDTHCLVSICYQAEDVSVQEKLFRCMLSEFHPNKMAHYFCKVLLLKQYVVLSIEESMQSLSPRKVYQFKKVVVERFINCGVIEL